jgi:hypothetical protein
MSDPGTVYIIAVHDISDPQKFWGAVKQAAMPVGVTIHSVLPNAGGSRAVCLWEGPSVDVIRDLVDGTVGDSAVNEFYAVDAQAARGLPAR